jgi:hypothetical protein
MDDAFEKHLMHPSNQESDQEGKGASRGIEKPGKMGLGFLR